MKKSSRIILLAVIIFISFPGITFSQSISPEVISSSGGDHTTADAGLQWTLGETFTGTLGFINGNQALGFHEIFLRPGLQHSHQALALQQHLSDVIIFPNPFTDNLYLYSTQNLGKVEVAIYSMTGTELYDGEILLPGSYTLELSFLKEGTYILRLAHATSQNLLIVKQAP